MSVTVSVIIVNWNTRELTLDAVDSVLSQAFDGGVEVIVVDNGSADGTIEALAGRPGVRTIASPVNLGYAGGNNLGLQRARGEFTLLLNSDAVLTPGALQTLVDDARAHPEAGAIGPPIARRSRKPRARQRMVGIENCAPSLMPDGQRAVTVLVCV